VRAQVVREGEVLRPEEAVRPRRRLGRACASRGEGDQRGRTVIDRRGLGGRGALVAAQREEARARRQVHGDAADGGAQQPQQLRLRGADEHLWRRHAHGRVQPAAVRPRIDEDSRRAAVQRRQQRHVQVGGEGDEEEHRIARAEAALGQAGAQRAHPAVQLAEGEAAPALVHDGGAVGMQRRPLRQPRGDVHGVHS
jgi:hypothetical protein